MSTDSRQKKKKRFIILCLIHNVIILSIKKQKQTVSSNVFPILCSRSGVLHIACDLPEVHHVLLG